MAATLTLRPGVKGAAQQLGPASHPLPQGGSRQLPAGATIHVIPQGNQGLARPGTLLLKASARVLNVPTSDLALPLLGANKARFTGPARAAPCQRSPTPGTAPSSPASPRKHCPAADGWAPESCWAGWAPVPGAAAGETRRGGGAGRKQAGCRCEAGLLSAGMPGRRFLLGPGPPTALLFGPRTLQREAGPDLGRPRAMDLRGRRRSGGAGSPGTQERAGPGPALTSLPHSGGSLGGGARPALVPRTVTGVT